MAEVRKFQQDAGEGIARLVRQQLGDIRPVEPGQRAAEPAEPEAGTETEEQDPGFGGVLKWDESGPTFQF